MTQINLGLYRILPFWSGLFIDWDQPGGSMHISPYPWDRAPA